MAGTKQGGYKTKEANLKRDPDFYRRIGKLGGAKSTTGGFGSSKVGKDGLTGAQRAQLAGIKGGTISKRGKSVKA